MHSPLFALLALGLSIGFGSPAPSPTTDRGVSPAASDSVRPTGRSPKRTAPKQVRDDERIPRRNRTGVTARGQVEHVAWPTPTMARSSGERPVPAPVLDGDASHRGRNVLIGAALGTGVGGFVGYQSCDDECVFSVGLLVAPVAGAALGALVALLLTPVR